jgi:hypothetical protein
MTAEEFRRMVLQDRAHGFVTIMGGHERAVSDPLDVTNNFGFCVQKSKIATSDLSPYTRNQIAAMEGRNGVWGDVDAYVNKLAPRNHTRRYFPKDQLQTISTTYLKFLIKERGFKGFSLVHFMAYEMRNWWSAFLVPILRAKAEYKLQGNKPAAETCKLV